MGTSKDSVTATYMAPNSHTETAAFLCVEVSNKATRGEPAIKMTVSYDSHDGKKSYDGYAFLREDQARELGVMLIELAGKARCRT